MIHKGNKNNVDRVELSGVADTDAGREVVRVMESRVNEVGGPAAKSSREHDGLDGGLEDGVMSIRVAHINQGQGVEVECLDIPLLVAVGRRSASCVLGVGR